ncbi:TPA: helix-turn-helix domain-containing protein [Legionella pneumophila subsp. pneumophila]|uniref:Helix-turn-helix domain-containing protein n=1 Tax=Legionella pneumophila (strain Lens) TaxID=297245 RepID=Q5WW79_LEGPL|nr:helix-turn-helix domain-containing protein [Legionella pneumophila]AOW51848.1 hypothetical protein BE841_04960 [Legionella pneumophila subsp. pneumophila]AOW54557.1 hypothetical protein BE842_03795 [Legionella pneumophila subsp. pneumophila]AOW57145.1 hypothetical protein BE843_02170 [Legionella pneumophila subsp. pneumophila]AOW59927.1 hypothetical protein BE844_01520 [Legionella pneumophila subsp. pneumophila]AOW62642.1 hypothetical protein BE845_00535 [Legionella pneumophila subsp. pneum
MGEKNSFMSTREAAKEAGYSPRHLQNFITSGKLSATRGVDGKYLIDRSEFYRVFPDAHKQKSQENSKEISEEIFLNEIKHLKEMNNFLHKQLETAEKEKNHLLETLKSSQKLLEHNSSEKTEKIKRKKIFWIF